MREVRTSDEWNKIVNDFDNSGLTASKFCDKNQIAKSTFQYWIKKYSKSKNLKLVKVKTITPSIIEKPIHLELNNFKLEIPNDITDTKLSKLISIIREDI